MADTLTDAHHHAQTARAAGNDSLDPDLLTTIRRRYRGATAAGISDNTARAGPLARDALTLAKRFRNHEDMILRFVVDLAVPFTNNQSEVRHEVARDEWTRRGEGQQMMLVA